MKKQGIMTGNDASLLKTLTPEAAKRQQAICETFNEAAVDMKVLVYSSRSYDKAFPESANQGK